LSINAGGAYTRAEGTKKAHLQSELILNTNGLC
jgi:hypothetical protein